MKSLIKSELRALERRKFRVTTRIDRILREDFKRQLYDRKPVDQLRLLTLDVWCQKYHVSMRYVLKLLIPHYQKMLKRNLPSASLGVAIATLVGKHSEEMLKEQLAKDFPQKENVEEWRWRKQRQLLQDREGGPEEGIAHRVRGLLDFPTVKGFVRAYNVRVEEERRNLDRAIQSDRNRLRTYRGTLWQ